MPRLTRLLLLLALLAASVSAAWADVPVPPLQARVTDLAGALSAGQRARLEADLRAFEERKGSQVAVLVLPTTQPETIEQYGIRVAEQWKVGRKRVDDGAILVVATQDRTLRIEVGYGLEGVLPDATAKRIIEEVIVPRFQAGDLPGGIQAGVASILKVIDGEPLPPPARSSGRSQRESEFGGNAIFFALFAALAAGWVLRSILGRLGGSVVGGGVAGVLGWLLTGTVIVGAIAAVIGFFVTLLGGMGGLGGPGFRHAGRGWGGGGFGGLGGGGLGGGGGFGGFSGGGGGFGGGGASGKW